MMKILAIGGMGFIGSHTVELLLEKGHAVRILDNLEPQAHDARQKPLEYNEDVEFVRGEVQNRKTLLGSLEGVDAVLHFAAAVGVGQSMYQIEKYVECNTRGTAMLLDVLVNESNRVKKLIVASSMSIYGEGKYSCEDCGVVYPRLRGEAQLKNKEWEPQCPNCGKSVSPLPTDEDKPLMPTSIYAQTKRHQEEMCLLVGRTYGIPTVALRYFNVYGSGQALSNPYTGVCAIFLSRILNGNSPHIFEDGGQTRDFVHVRDIAEANVLALKKNRVDYMTVNIGLGKPTSIKQVAELVNFHHANVIPHISNRYRKGDIRHCYADITRAEKCLDYKPMVALKEGFREFIEWAEVHSLGVVDSFEKAMRELEEKNLA